MGHVVNYAYKLYETKEWLERFGSMEKPYEDEYRPRPFSREFVHHLPGGTRRSTRTRTGPRRSRSG